MNWVGGARSRVKQHAEKKIQKDYFERKRLANRVQRIRPSLPKVKASISQDLLFLKATVSNASSKRMSPRLLPKPLSLEPGRGDRPSARPQRDLELPMSPIGEPSNLDIMDCSTVLSEKRDGRDHIGDGSGGGRSLERGMDELPRVSTQKIPHRTVLDSFGPPKIKDLGDFMHPDDDHHRKPHTVPSMDDHFMNVSGITESLFPPPVKQRKISDYVERKKIESNRKSTGAKKYSLDDILNLHHQSSKDLNPALADNLGRGSRARGIEHAGPAGTKWNYLAKGDGRLESKTAVPWRRPKEERQTGYNFDRWAPFIENITKNRDHPPRTTALRNDPDAMLELHYAKDKDLEVLPGDVHLDMPVIAKEETGRKDKTRRDEMPRQSRSSDGSHVNTLSWESNKIPTSSLFSENPFSKRKIPQAFVGPPASNSMDLDESIFGPLCHKSRYNEREKKDHYGCPEEAHHSITKCEQISDHTNSFNTTEFDESIFGPLLHKNERKKKKHPINHGPSEGKHHSSTKHEQISDRTNSINTTKFDESILGPLLGAKRRELARQPHGDNHSASYSHHNENSTNPILSNENKIITSAVRREESQICFNTSRNEESILGSILTAKCKRHETGVSAMRFTGAEEFSSGSSTATKKGLSAFEIMMKSLERPTKQESKSDSKQGTKRDDDQSELSSGQYDNNANLPSSGPFPALPIAEASEGAYKSKAHSSPFKKKSIGNISVLHELMCLEEEISAHYEDGLLSQNSPLTESSENPLFGHLPKGNQSKCPFDSSQESELEKSKKVRESAPVDTVPFDTNVATKNSNNGFPNAKSLDTLLLKECSGKGVTLASSESSCIECPGVTHKLSKTLDTASLEVCITTTETCADSVATSGVAESENNSIGTVQGLDSSIMARDDENQSRDSCTVDNLTRAFESHRSWRHTSPCVHSNDSKASKSDTNLRSNCSLSCIKEEDESKCTSYLVQKENEELKQKIEELEETLATAESTVIWQSLMIKLYQMDTAS